MDKNNKLKKAYNYCPLLKNETIKNEINSYLINYYLDDINLENGKFECEFLNKNNKIYLSIFLKEIKLYENKENILTTITIGEDQILNEIKLEKRENGIIYTEIKKRFAKSNRFQNKTVLVDLIEDSYVFSRDKINRIIDKEDFSDVRLMYILLKIKKYSLENNLRDISDLYNRFSTHMNYYLNWEINWEGGRLVKDNIYPTKTYLNNEDISMIFDMVDGPDKLYRVYDLYRGIINPRNEFDINSINLGFLSEDAFDYKKLKGITDRENELVGKTIMDVSYDYIEYLSKMFYDKFGYKGEVKVDRENLLKGITYQMTELELTKRQIERKLGISYEEYEKLDIDEQHKLILEKTGKKVQPDYRLYIDGIPIDEDHIITRKQIDNKLEKITESLPKRLLKRLLKK